jgi:hypothetical protein
MKLNARNGQGTVEKCHGKSLAVAGVDVQFLRQRRLVHHPAVVMPHSHGAAHPFPHPGERRVLQAFEGPGRFGGSSVERRVKVA